MLINDDYNQVQILYWSCVAPPTKSRISILAAARIAKSLKSTPSFDQFTLPPPVNISSDPVRQRPTVPWRLKSLSAKRPNPGLSWHPGGRGEVDLVRRSRARGPAEPHPIPGVSPHPWNGTPRRAHLFPDKLWPICNGGNKKINPRFPHNGIALL